MKHIQLFEEFVNESTIQDFIKDVKNHDDILSSGAYEKDGEIVVYLDGSDPDAEMKAINKLVRTKYKNKLKKVNDGSEDSITFKVLKESKESVNEAKSFQFIFNYNTDEDDVEYIQNILMDAGVDAIAEPGIDSEEMVVKAPNAVELRKAKKAIQADGFEINESQTFIKESAMGDVYVMAGEADSFTAFKKEFMDEYGKPKSVKELKALEAWLQTIWKENQTNESILNERNTKLYVYPTSKKDHQMISNWLEGSAFHAEENSNYFMFPVEGQRDADRTEMDLDKEFDKLGASVRYELE
jgi:hypothetical protein